MSGRSAKEINLLIMNVILLLEFLVKTEEVWVM